MEIVDMQLAPEGTLKQGAFSSHDSLLMTRLCKIQKKMLKTEYAN